MSDTKDSEAATIAVEVNGQRQTLAAATVAGLLETRGLEPTGRGLAVALNGAVLPRAAWSTTVLRNGDTVEIVQAKQGG